MKVIYNFKQKTKINDNDYHLELIFNKNLYKR